jgi:hypothetical protein
VNGPRDLPELRLWLLDMWRGPFLAHAATSVADRFMDDPRYAHLDPHAEPHFLNRAELWWITPEMSRLVRRAAESLPPTTLTEELIPKNKVVFAVFAEPLIGTDAEIEGSEMNVRALLWYRCRVVLDPNPDHHYATVAMYGDAPTYMPDDVPYVPLGHTDWRYGTDTEVPTFNPRPDDADATRLESMAQDRRWLAALNLLAAEPLAETRIVRQTNKAKIRRYQRDGIPGDVRLVGLRTAPQSEAGEDEPRKVNWSHRWVVGQDTGGFWKQVVYGPGRSLRRPQWIMPYEKGPKNKPLVIKDTVRVVREDP